MLNFTVFVCALIVAVLAVAAITGASFVFLLPVVAAPTLGALTIGIFMFDDDARERPEEFEWRRW
jgi:hypothetical protein